MFAANIQYVVCEDKVTFLSCHLQYSVISN